MAKKAKYPKVGEKFLEVEGTGDPVYVVSIDRVRGEIGFSYESDEGARIVCDLEDFPYQFSKFVTFE